jgi:hypothetical protein
VLVAKMLGRLGWRGQCACCNGPRYRKQIRAEERLGWLREAAADRVRTMPDYPDPPEVTAERGDERTFWLGLQMETGAWVCE